VAGHPISERSVTSGGIFNRFFTLILNIRV